MKILLMVASSLFLLVMPALAANSETNFGGVGIDGLPMPDGQIRVSQLVIGGPAQIAGIQIGDTITHIDGKATQGSDFRTMVQKRLRGVAGTPVVLKIKREGEEKSLTFKLTRRQIAIPPIKEK
jgi:C-terminal processing protease CtpA/Prc